MDNLMKISKETLKLNEEYKSIEKMLKEKKEKLFDLFIQEDIESHKVDNYTIFKIPENEQIRLVKREDILNVLTDEIDDVKLIEAILSKILKNSKTKSYIKIVQKN